MQGNTLYEFGDDRIMTKSEIEDMIIALKRDYDSLDSPVAKMKGITDIEVLHKQRDEALAECYKELEKAPEKIEQKEHTLSYAKHFLGGNANIDGEYYKINISDGAYSYTSMPEDIHPKILFTRIHYSEGKRGEYYSKISNTLFAGGEFIITTKEQNSEAYPNYKLYPVTEQPETMNMTKEEAIELAENTFRAIGADNSVKVSDIYYCEVSDYALACYAIQLKRYVGEVPIYFTGTQTDIAKTDPRESDAKFALAVPNEIMSIYINDSGIIALEWAEPLEMAEELNSNVATIEYEKAIENFKQGFVNIYSYDEMSDWGEDFQQHNVGGIMLNYGLARYPDNKKIFMTIPLWRFHKTSKESCNSTLVINGIDGSMFNPYAGY